MDCGYTFVTWDGMVLYALHATERLLQVGRLNFGGLKLVYSITWFISKSPTQVSRPLDLTRENQKNRVLLSDSQGS
jgi:hypothetical protein